MIVECVGLPGAGKTTICGLVTAPHGKKGAVPLSAMRADTALLRAAWRIFFLSISARPLSLNRLKRGFNLIVFLRHYQFRVRNILLDQGLVQKLWSLLQDASFSMTRLDRVIASLRLFAPDHLVWIVTPVNLSAQRIAERRHGNSRLDGLPPDEAEARLATTVELLEMLVARFSAASGVNVLKLNGGAPPEANAARIDGLLGRMV